PFQNGHAIATTGTSGADMLIGDLHADTLDGGGGEDVFRGGAGDDTLILGDTSFADIDGGTGSDTLVLGGGGNATLSLTLEPPAEIKSVEWIDLGDGNNTLVIDELAALDLTEERSDGTATIHVEGDADDRVNLAGGPWSSLGTIVEGSTTFERFTHGAAE